MFENKKSQSGFTLIELIIAIAIIGLLASIAYPAYTESVNRAKRAQAQTAIVSLAQAMERYFTANNTYVGAAIGTVFPASVPATGTAVYTLSFVDPGTAGLTAATPVCTALAPTATNYGVCATRVSGGAMANDTCGNFAFTAAGAKTLVGYSTTKFASLSAAIAGCWK